MEMERKYQEYKDINEQVLYLYNSKKIIVDVEDRHYLEERNYVSLVKPYKAFFSTGRNNKGKLVYKKETNFKEVIKLVNLDDAYAKMLYELIGVFERKFKSVLFAEICHNYVACDNSDIYCVRYVDEIKRFINDETSELPLFCPSFYCFYVKDKNGVKRLRECEVPLWVIPNALTLGELQILFMMLDEKSQKTVAAKMLKSSVEKMSAHSILSFNGHIEKIRKLRNVVNHYEPLLPFLMDEMDTKKIENSQLYNTLNLLHKTSDLTLPRIEEINAKVNPSNSRIVRILNMMYENISLTNK